MSKLREERWQAMNNGNAQYCWNIVRHLERHGVDDFPTPHVPDQDDASLDDLKEAEESFKKAIKYCKKYTPGEWKAKYGVRNADAATRQLERGLRHIRREKDRLHDALDADDDDLAMTVAR